MKELKNLEAIRELLASHPIYTYNNLQYQNYLTN